MYGFAAGDPINFSDPFGLCPLCTAAGVSAAATLTGPAFDQLNPKGFVVNNSLARLNTVALYANLADQRGNDGFEFQVTGGDRYEELSVVSTNAYSGTERLNVTIRSSTDGSMVGGSAGNSQHLDRNGGSAVDLRINGVPNSTVDAAIGKTGFDPSKTRRNYPENPHTHVALPNKPR